MAIKTVFGRDITNGEYFTDEMIQSYNDVFYSQTSEGMLWTDESTGNTLVYFKEKPHNQFVLGFVITAEGELYQIGVAKPYVIEKGEIFQDIHKNGIANMIPVETEVPVDPEPVEPIDPIEPTRIVVNVARDIAMSDIFTHEEKVYFFNETKYENTDIGDIEIRVYFNKEFNTYLELWLTEEPVVEPEPTEPEVPVDPEPSKPYGDEILEDIITINRPNPVALGEWLGFENTDWEVVEVVNDVLFIAKKAGEENYRAFRTDYSIPVEPEAPVEEIKLNGTVINPNMIEDLEIRENLKDLIAKLEKLSFRKEKGIDIYQVIEFGVEVNILKATNYFVVGETGTIVAKKFNFDLPGDLIMITAMLENDIAEFVQAHAPIEVPEEPVDHLVSIEEEITY